MAFNHQSMVLLRVIFLIGFLSGLIESEETEEIRCVCALFCPPDCTSLLAPPPSKNHRLSPLVIIIIVVLGSCFLLISYYAILAKYCSSFNRSITPPPQLSDTREDFIDENHGPVIDHPIWYINTVGLEQSIINSISICKYKKGDGLVEGTECSVCLNEFQEDENLRLLPKCSHAFHLPCIDTWLRSHTNCPLCRAPIVVSIAVGSNSTAAESNLSNLGSEEETQIEYSVGDDGLGRDLSGEDGVVIEEERESQNELRDVDVAKVGLSFPLAGCELQVFDDLADRQRVLEDGIQPVRRSVSMDSSSVASMFCFSLANFLPVEPEESSEPELVGEKKSNLGIIAKRVGGSPSIFKLMGRSSSSKGGSLHRGSVSMKRSCSSGGKFLSSRYSSNRDSILPL